MQVPFERSSRIAFRLLFLRSVNGGFQSDLQIGDSVGGGVAEFGGGVRGIGVGKGVIGAGVIGIGVIGIGVIGARVVSTLSGMLPS